MPRQLILALAVLTAFPVVASSCGEAEDVISREQFVEAYVALRAVSQRHADEEIPVAERDRVLQELGLTPEDLLEFVEVRGGDATFMHEVWEEIDNRFREIRSTPPPPPRPGTSRPPGGDPS
jgi:hypothetical protein